MRIAHIILSHKNPTQVERLIKVLYHPDSDFYIHVDKKIDQAPFEYLAELKQVTFIKKRHLCNWGGFSLVESMLTSIDQVQETGIAYDFLNLLSGQDYPIKSAQEIYNFFNNNLGYSFLSFDESRESKWWKGAEDRYRKFHFTDTNFKGKYTIQHIANKFLPKRKFPVSLHLYGGNKGCWWTLSYDSALYLSAQFKRNPKLSKFLKLTWGSDEFILSTLLMNSVYKDKIINENYRYIDWSANEAHPKNLGIEDYDKIIRSEMLFARKFDINIDDEILQKLDKHIHIH